MGEHPKARVQICEQTHIMRLRLQKGLKFGHRSYVPMPLPPVVDRIIDGHCSDLWLELFGQLLGQLVRTLEKLKSIEWYFLLLVKLKKFEIWLLKLILHLLSLR